MIGIIFLIASIACGVLYCIVLKPGTSRCNNSSESQYFNGCLTIFAAIFAAIVSITKGSLYIPLTGLLASFLFGVIFSVDVFMYIKSITCGPVSLTTLIVNFSLIFSLVYSFVFLNEPVTPLKIFGISLLVITLFMLVNPKLGGNEKISKKWIFSTLIALCCDGMLVLVVKIYSMASNNQYTSQYLMYGYIFATISSFIIATVLRFKLPKEQRISPKKFFTPIILISMAVTGLSNFGLNFFVSLLATLMDGSIVYPVVCGGIPIFTTVFSLIFLKEKMDLRKAFAIVIGVAAIVVLNLK